MEKLKLLLLEDVSSDAELVVLTLERSGMNFTATFARNKEEFIRALDKDQYDVILADNNLPQFDSLEAIKIIADKGIDVPFILVTGSISEEYAVEMMKQGTWDYILKDRLQRLPNAIHSALHKYKLAAQNSRYMEEVIANEALLKEASRLAHFGSWETDVVNNSERWSDEQFRILGYVPGEVEPNMSNFLRRVHPDDAETMKDALKRICSSPQRQRFECRITDDEENVKYVAGEMLATYDDNGKLLRINGVMQDVSVTKNAELLEKKITKELIRRNKDLEQFAYIISHNLRGPVANIVGISEALLDNNMNDEDRDSFMDALSISIRKLDTVIIDLNHIIQVKNNVNENKEYVDFNELIDDVISGFGNALQKNDISLNCDFTMVSGMATLKSYLQSICYNLISNSIKFRRKDAHSVINIKSRMHDDNVILSFADNGIGIDLQKRGGQVFGLYKRFHADYAEGRGMGLFMVKTQTEALGGKICIKSEVGKGTEFILEFEHAGDTH